MLSVVGTEGCSLSPATLSGRGVVRAFVRSRRVGCGPGGGPGVLWAAGGWRVTSSYISTVYASRFC
jgi:hypothetical protein